MKVAVCGSSRSNDRSIERLSYQLGQELAKASFLVMTGGCEGYPHEVAKGAYALKGAVMGISPAVDMAEHIKKFGFPQEPFTQLEFTGLGIPARNYALVSQADALIIISGQAGTLNEFTVGFVQQKPIGVLEGSGGITRFLREIALLCDKRGESKNVLFSARPQDLVMQLREVLSTKTT